MLFSCKNQKTAIIESTKTNFTDSDLSKVENNIVNDFLDIELRKEKYKNYKGYQYIVNEEALKKRNALSAYELNYKYKNSWGRDIKFWILDSIQIRKIKTELEFEKVYLWKESDFNTIKAKVFKNEELRKTTNNGRYLKNNLIIFLSRPLIIDEYNALLSFDIGNGDMGNYAITHFTALTQKVNGIWIQKEYYEDGVYY